MKGLTKVRAALRRLGATATAWRAMRARIAALTDEELAIAEEFERLGALNRAPSSPTRGRPRQEVLKTIQAERRKRAGRTDDEPVRVEAHL